MEIITIYDFCTQLATSLDRQMSYGYFEMAALGLLLFMLLVHRRKAAMRELKQRTTARMPSTLDSVGRHEIY